MQDQRPGTTPENIVDAMKELATLTDYFSMRVDADDLLAFSFRPENCKKIYGINTPFKLSELEGWLDILQTIVDRVKNFSYQEHFEEMAF